MMFKEHDMAPSHILLMADVNATGGSISVENLNFDGKGGLVNLFVCNKTG